MQTVSNIKSKKRYNIHKVESTNSGEKLIIKLNIFKSKTVTIRLRRIRNRVRTKQK